MNSDIPLANRRRAFAVALALAVISSVWIVYDLCRISRAQACKPDISFKRVMQKLNAASKTQKTVLIDRNIAGYRQALRLTDDPDAWLCLGRLYLKKYRNFPQDPALLNKAATALKNAAKQMPGRGEIYFYLGQVYREQNQERSCAQAMARSQILTPHRIDLARDMATYWASVLGKFPGRVCLPLLAERFYFLNTLNLRRYGKLTLLIWTRCANTSPWGVILPKQDKYALAASRFYLDYSEFDRARQFLEYVKEKQNLAEKYMILGHTHLRSLDPEQAIFCYEKSLQSANNKDIMMEIVSTLICAGCLDQAISLLAIASIDNVENRVALAKFAMRRGYYRRIFSYLQKTENLEKPAKSASLYSLLAKCARKLENIAKAISYAEKAAQLAPASQDYAMSYFSLLFSQGLEDTASLHMQNYGRYLPRAAILYDMLARGYLHENRLNQAKENAEKAVKLDPNNMTFSKNLDNIYSKIAIQGK